MDILERWRSADSVARPDLLLAGLPVAFLVTFALGRWIVGSRIGAVVAASLVCGYLVLDGLFVNPPLPEETE
ncbi:hypothetical protein [Halorhabdus amylolytica]|uniref:hypothetical protein n=1 Tax=Halorhabdus amylolytica TaxID=2559573 RepID=UPI0010AA2FBA|nr:hypothetical protein [Halorhabdus amylolytica]